MSEGDYGLVMPFVVCQSNGGPFDDAAFVAGVQFGDLSRQLAGGGPVEPAYVNPDLWAQLDLAAMHYGYRLIVQPWDEHNMLVELEKVQT
jgi:hypothetical protein